MDAQGASAMGQKLTLVQRQARLEEYEAFTDELISLYDDRAYVILTAAYLEEQLGALLQRFLIEDKTVEDLFGVDQPLGTFGSKTKLAYCLGLISVNEFKDLEAIRWIRNQFAHGLHDWSFDRPEIADRCHSFRFVQTEKNTDVRLWSAKNQYAFTFYAVSLILRGRLAKARKTGFRRTRCAEHIPGQ
jgi:DNA-binding MltR family transcriptional regulator